MQRITWLLHNNVPVIEVQLTDPFGFTFFRRLLADTGAGPSNSPFELVLSQVDCQRLSTMKLGRVGLGGAIPGFFDLHAILMGIPALSFVRQVRAVAVPSIHLPDNLQGIASFRFLNSFIMVISVIRTSSG